MRRFSSQTSRGAKSQVHVGLTSPNKSHFFGTRKWRRNVVLCVGCILLLLILHPIESSPAQQHRSCLQQAQPSCLAPPRLDLACQRRSLRKQRRRKEEDGPNRSTRRTRTRIRTTLLVLNLLLQLVIARKAATTTMWGLLPRRQQIPIAMTLTVATRNARTHTTTTPPSRRRRSKSQSDSHTKRRTSPICPRPTATSNP